MSNLSGEEGSFSSGNTANSNAISGQPPAEKKPNLPGIADPSADVVVLSPETNQFVCEICNKVFQRDQNLQMHMRGHNLPWKLR